MLAAWLGTADIHGMRPWPHAYRGCPKKPAPKGGNHKEELPDVPPARRPRPGVARSEPARRLWSLEAPIVITPAAG